MSEPSPYTTGTPGEYPDAAPPTAPPNTVPSQAEVRQPRTWPLTARLVAVVTSLVILATMLIGAITLFSLKETMQQQVDDQLFTAIKLVEQQRSTDFHQIDPGHDFILLPGLPTGTLGVIVYQGFPVRAAMISADGGSIIITERTVNTITSVEPMAPPISVYLGDGLGSYRLAADALPSGANIVIGLSLSEMNTTLRHQQSYVLLVAIIVSVLSALFGFLLIRWNLRPLKQVAEAATTISQMKLDKGEVDLQVHLPDASHISPRNEVGQVGLAFRLMLDNIRSAFSARQASEQQVRDFVADASHELRTPLASIRGYAELTRMQDPNLNDDVRHSIDRIAREADRMTSLVEDMLLLASLDANRPLRQQPVDLSRLLIDVLSDAQAAGPDHHWQLELAEQETIVIGDEEKLHQMMANLLTNARVHTPEGSQVTLSLACTATEAMITVADNGPGIPVEQQTKMFQRFMRGDSSRSRKTGSTGLGLAIVQAIAHAHAGTITLNSSPGDTRFTVTLPLS